MSVQEIADMAESALVENIDILNDEKFEEMLASNLSTEIQTFDIFDKFYTPLDMNDTQDEKITSQDFPFQVEDLGDYDLNQEQTMLILGEDSNSLSNSPNSIYTGKGDIMLGAGNEWCDDRRISQPEYVTSSSLTNTMKRKATKTMTNTTTLPVKRNKLDLTVRIQSSFVPESTSTHTVGQATLHNLDTASICDDILDMQAPIFPIPQEYVFPYSPPETETCQDYHIPESPVPQPSQIIIVPHSPDSSSIISDIKHEDQYQFSATNSPSTEFSAPASPASSYPFSPTPSTSISSPNSNTTNNTKRRRGRPAKIVSTEPDEAELSKCKTKAERDHYLRRFRNNEASRKSRLLNKQKTEKVEQDIRKFEQENMSLEADVESDKIKIKLLKDYIQLKLTANIQTSYNKDLVH